MELNGTDLDSSDASSFVPSFPNSFVTKRERPLRKLHTYEDEKTAALSSAQCRLLSVKPEWIQHHQWRSGSRGRPWWSGDGTGAGAGERKDS